MFKYSKPQSDGIPYAPYTNAEAAIQVLIVPESRSAISPKTFLIVLSTSPADRINSIVLLWKTSVKCKGLKLHVQTHSCALLVLEEKAVSAHRG